MSQHLAPLALLKGIFTVLSADLALQSELGDPLRLYDSAPEDPLFPYLTYGQLRSEDISGQGARTEMHTLSLHIWSRYNGRKEVLDLQSEITRVIESGTWTLEGAELISAAVIYRDVFTAPDGRTFHGVMRIRAVTEIQI